MPGYKGHLVGGTVAFGLLFFALVGVVVRQPSMLIAGEWLLFALAGSLFPDIDIKSKGQKYFYFDYFVRFSALNPSSRPSPRLRRPGGCLLLSLSKYQGERRKELLIFFMFFLLKKKHYKV